MQVWKYTVGSYMKIKGVKSTWEEAAAAWLVRMRDGRRQALEAKMEGQSQLAENSHKKKGKG
jgi:hypothetical protein